MLNRQSSVTGRAGLALATGTALIAGAFVAPAQATAPAAAPSKSAPGADQVQAPVPKIAWQACPTSWGSNAAEKDPKLGVRFSCSTAKVPLDYDTPKGSQITLALRRVAATDQKNKIGTIFWNPGGPGGSGVNSMDSAWSYFSPWVRQKFDIVGFDPRGIALSTPLTCWPSLAAQTKAGTGVEMFPINDAQYKRTVGYNQTLVKNCAKYGGAIMNHMSTANVARDMDLLRQAVGDQKLTYTGVSYGTELGQTYANLFPNRIRAMVIDAVLDPQAYGLGNYPGQAATQGTFLRVGSDIGTWDTMQQFFALCARASTTQCSLKQFGDPQAVYAKLAARMRKAPISLEVEGGTAQLNYQDLVMSTLSGMYAPSGWPDLADFISVLAISGGVVKAPAATTTKLSHSAAALMDTFAGKPVQVDEGLPGVACIDGANPTTYEAVRQSGNFAEKRAPYAGTARAWHTAPCTNWPGKDTDRYTGPWSTNTSAPVLIVGTTHDPATPYPGALAARKYLPNSVLLTYQGWGHPAIGKNVCTDNAISNYLLSGALPGDGSTCAAKASPFDTAATMAAMGPVSAAVKAYRLRGYASMARISMGLTE